MVKQESIFSLFKYFIGFRSMPKVTDTAFTMLLFVGVIVDIAIITAIRSYLEYSQVIANTLQILIGMPILWLIFYSLYYVFQNAFQEKAKIPFWNSYIAIGIPVLTGTLTIHVINLLQYISGSPYINYLFALINIVLIIYLLVMFVGNMKHYFNTTYPKVLASLILVFIT
ncbi:MAG: hypothetical protein VXZ40_01980, partial [Nanoarchaeota archaeon]|nr:hypothetical protein [Nanoarchaeota archaeon]